MGRKLLKLGVLGALLVGLGFGVRLGWKKLFIENEEFALREMPLTTPAGEEPMFMTRSRVTEVTGIDLSASIFAFDVDDIEEALRNLPEISAARVARRLPGTLKVEVAERIPVAWLACPALGIEERSIEKGLLVDSSGVAFPCVTPALADYAENLPVVFAGELPTGAIVAGQRVNHEGLNYALELAQKADDLLSDSELPDWIMVKDEITLEMMTVGGTRATLSYFEQEKQLEKLQQAVAHVRNRDREIATINLIPNRYIPVTYRDTH